MQEIGAREVRIALVVASVNSSSLDRGLDARVREIRFIQNQSSRDFGEIKRAFQDVSSEELQHLKVVLKKVCKRADSLAEKKRRSAG
jgi:hypothetical protein